MEDQQSLPVCGCDPAGRWAARKRLPLESPASDEQASNSRDTVRCSWHVCGTPLNETGRSNDPYCSRTVFFRSSGLRSLAGLSSLWAVRRRCVHQEVLVCAKLGNVRRRALQARAESRKKRERGTICLLSRWELCQRVCAGHLKVRKRVGAAQHTEAQPHKQGFTVVCGGRRQRSTNTWLCICPCLEKNLS